MKHKLWQSWMGQFNYEIIKVIVIEFKQFPKFDPAIFHADVELDARIFSSIEDYITELNIDELCLEDIFIQLLEGKISSNWEIRRNNWHMSIHDDHAASTLNNYYAKDPCLPRKFNQHVSVGPHSTKIYFCNIWIWYQIFEIETNFMTGRRVRQ